MAGVSASATGVAYSWLCKPIENTINYQIPNSKSSTSSQFPIHQNLKSPVKFKAFQTHCHHHHHHLSDLSIDPFDKISHLEKLVLRVDLDPATAKVAIGLLGPFLSAFGFLFILRIVMSWYPKLPVEKFPYVIAYAPTEPLLVQTRKVIPPVGGVDVTPVVWFGLLSFLNEILVGPQGLLVLLSQQV